MAKQDDDKGPDLSQGVSLADIPPGGVLAGHVGDDPVLLARVGGDIVAVGGACTHYGGPLGKGLRSGDTVRCPWHHACFDLRSGHALEAPAFDPLPRFRVEVQGDKAVVTGGLDQDEPRPAPAVGQGPKRIVLVGGGAAAFAAIRRLRDLGYGGELTLVSAEADVPYDRPNLSKDYLAGEAEPDWIPLKDRDFYEAQRVTLKLGDTVEALDVEGRAVVLAGGERLAYDALLLATGAEPNRLDLPGLDRPEVHVLRSLKDSDALIAAAERAKAVAIIGSSFIGLEAAAALRKRGLRVEVISPEAAPLQSKLGPEIAAFVKRLHEDKGVRFHLQRQVKAFDGHAVELDDGARIAADLVVLGVGVKPRIALAKAAGLRTGRGVCVDANLRTSAPGVFAAGDIAEFPDPVTGQPIRVEHWVLAERHGQVAAANMLGGDERFSEPPFFWSAHYDTSIRYVGHAEGWDRIEVDGLLDDQDAEVRFLKAGEVCAVATVGRDLASLEARERLAARAKR